jgi:hypothetical protein
VFDATVRKYPHIQFERINIDEGDPRCTQYNSRPIPKVIFLDSQGKEIPGGSTWGDPDSFGEMLK